MRVKSSSTWLVLAFCLFCGQAFTAPFMACCNPFTGPEDRASMQSMPVNDHAGHMQMTSMHEHSMQGHSMEGQQSHDMNCGNHCGFCFSSAGLALSELQLADFYLPEQKQAANIDWPFPSLSDIPYRPPILA